ncbi:MAG: tetratricopeptide repeat protein [Planctomycetes bacterium]|nr:tetratricopeptide repeat protein [Planctomycetota bacterium]
MKITRSISHALTCIVLALPALAAAPAWRDDAAREPQSAQAERLIAEGRAEEALELLATSVQAARAARNGSADSAQVLARELNNLALAQSAVGRFDQARESAHEALELMLSWADSSPGAAAARRTLAEVARAAGELDEAAVWIGEAIRDLETLYGKTPMIAQAREFAAQIDFELGQFDSAAEHFERALAIYERYLGHANERTAGPVAPLASIHARRGETARAIQLLRGAQQILTNAGKRGQPAWLATSLQLVDVLALAGRDQDAFAELQALESVVFDANEGDAAARTAKACAVAEGYLDLGRPIEAVRVHRRSLAVLARAEPSVPEQAQAWLLLARAALMAGESSSALEACDQVLAHFCSDGDIEREAQVRALLVRARIRFDRSELEACRADIRCALESALAMRDAPAALVLEALAALDTCDEFAAAASKQR